MSKKRRGGFIPSIPGAIKNACVAIPREIKSVWAQIMHGMFGCPEDLILDLPSDDIMKRAFQKCIGCGWIYNVKYCKHEYVYIPGGETGYSAVCKLCKKNHPVKRGHSDLEYAIKKDQLLQTVVKLREENKQECQH